MKDIEVHWPISSKRSKIPYLAHDYPHLAHELPHLAHELPHLAHDFRVDRDGVFTVNARKLTG